MSYRGLMDGYHGDENECHGTCGRCEECDSLYDQRCDEAYDSWRDEEAA